LYTVLYLKCYIEVFAVFLNEADGRRNSQMSIYIHTYVHTYMCDRIRDRGGKGKPELRDRLLWKIGANGKMTQSVSEKIVHFAFWPISVLGTVYVDSC
jgi:hypothetical protein